MDECFPCSSFGIEFSVTELGFEQIEEKDPEVDEERVPHHDEGEGGPHDVAVPKKVEEGEKVGSDIREW